MLYIPISWHNCEYLWLQFNSKIQVVQRERFSCYSVCQLKRFCASKILRNVDTLTACFHWPSDFLSDLMERKYYAIFFPIWMGTTPISFRYWKLSHISIVKIMKKSGTEWELESETKNRTVSGNRPKSRQLSKKSEVGNRSLSIFCTEVSW